MRSIKTYNQFINESSLAQKGSDWIPDWAQGIGDFIEDMIPDMPKRMEDVPGFIISLLKLTPSALALKALWYVIEQFFPKFKTNVKVRFIFPKGNWENIAGKLLTTLGIVTGSFKNASEAIEQVNFLIQEEIKPAEIAIISHGSGEWKTMMDSDSGKSFDNFIRSMKPILQSNTTIFFTSFNSNDYLGELVNAATILKHPVTCAAGIYDYIQVVKNDSEKGYYSGREITNQDHQKIKEKYPNLYKAGNPKSIPSSILLEFGICKKLSKSPISWVEPGTVAG